MKKILRNIAPHIIPEFILFLTRILPGGALIAVTLFQMKASFYFQNQIIMLLIGTLTCVVGIYLMRISAYAVKSTLIKIKYIIPDVYYDESLNDKK